MFDLFGGGLTTKITMVGLFVAVVVLGGQSFSKSIALSAAETKISKHEVTITRLETDNAILKKNVETITNVNKTNVETNNKLLEERKDAQAAIQELAKQKLANKKKLDDVNRFVDLLLKDPKNNGAVAPVLRETIKSIQGQK